MQSGMLGAVRIDRGCPRGRGSCWGSKDRLGLAEEEGAPAGAVRNWGEGAHAGAVRIDWGCPRRKGLLLGQ